MDLSRDDFRELRESLTDAMNRGFDGVHGRLDVLNGRTGKLEAATAVHEERWQRLDRATNTTSRAKPTLEEDLGIKGDWKVLVGMGTMIGGALYGIWQAAKSILR